MDNSVSRRNSLAQVPEALSLADSKSDRSEARRLDAAEDPDRVVIPGSLPHADAYITPRISRAAAHRPHSFALSHSNAADKPAAELMLAITPAAAAIDDQRGDIRDPKSPPEDSEIRARRTRVDGYLNEARRHALRETQAAQRERQAECKKLGYLVGGVAGALSSVFPAVLIADELWPFDGEIGSFTSVAAMGIVTISGAVVGACASRLFPSRLFPCLRVRDRLDELNNNIAQVESVWRAREEEEANQVMQHSRLPMVLANMVADYRGSDLPELLRQAHPLLRQTIPEHF